MKKRNPRARTQEVWLHKDNQNNGGDGLKLSLLQKEQHYEQQNTSRSSDENTEGTIIVTRGVEEQLNGEEGNEQQQGTMSELMDTRSGNQSP